MSRSSKVVVRGTFPDGGSLWSGKNRREHGGEFFIGLTNEADSQALRIPKADQVKVAKWLRRFADRLDPQSIEEPKA